ncbi:MAG TPA: hypothetical protein VL359_20945 [bacterium]|nr:hypothetical protein [bacterium]
MQLFVDIDGVLLDFERGFVRWLNNQHGMGLPQDYEPADWGFTDVLDPEELQRRWMNYMASPEAGRMEALIDPGHFNALTRPHTVHLLTNFPLHHMDKRVENLALLGFAYQSLHHCGFIAFEDTPPQSKAQAIAELRRSHLPALFVDDHPHNCLDVVRNCPDVDVWLMSRRFNRTFDHPQVRRAEGWSSLLQHLGASGPP